LGQKVRINHAGSFPGGIVAKAADQLEIVFWIICGAGFLLAFWQYGQMISSYAE